ncbi:hypothetical protein Avbf_11993 [Armadillidium vulgare]|nr:hypothetical protein Avbf_11993 [Armadillidium vulgare]
MKLMLLAKQKIGSCLQFHDFHPVLYSLFYFMMSFFQGFDQIMYLVYFVGDCCISIREISERQVLGKCLSTSLPRRS